MLSVEREHADADALVLHDLAVPVRWHVPPARFFGQIAMPVRVRHLGGGDVVVVVVPEDRIPLEPIAKP